MKISVFVVALAPALATIAPLGAAAQGAPPPAPAAASNTPPPDVRARMGRARDDARSAAFDGLSAAHRGQVESIVDQVNGGQVSDLRAAAKQIDAILTPDEKRTVLAAGATLRNTMRLPGAGVPGETHGAPPGTPAGDGPPAPGVPAADPPPGPPDNGPRPQGVFRAPDPGLLLLLLGVNDDRMHALFHAQQDGPPPH